MWPEAIAALAAGVVRGYAAQGRLIATAESCTGGMLAGSLTEVAGSSAIFDRGWVTYSNEAKADCLGVPPDLLAEHGAVSAAVAAAMAAGALERALAAAVALSVTGIAGPGGATATKPVGLVYLGLAQRGEAVRHVECRFSGTRTEVRFASIEQGLRLLLAALPAPDQAVVATPSRTRFSGAP